MTPEALRSKVQLGSHNLQVAFYITKESKAFLGFMKEFVGTFTLFLEKLFQNDSVHDNFSSRTQVAKISFIYKLNVSLAFY